MMEIEKILNLKGNKLVEVLEHSEPIDNQIKDYILSCDLKLDEIFMCFRDEGNISETLGLKSKKQELKLKCLLKRLKCKFLIK